MVDGAVPDARTSAAVHKRRRRLHASDRDRGGGESRRTTSDCPRVQKFVVIQ